MTDTTMLSTEELAVAVEQVMKAEPLFTCEPRTIRGVDYDKVFSASDLSLRDLLAAKTQEFAQAEFMVCEGQRFLFQDVWKMACQFANVLIEKYNVQPADRVAIAMRNYPEWCIAYIGIIAAGGTVVPLNSWWKTDELKYGLEDSGARIVVCDDKRAGFLKTLKGELDLTLISAHEKTEHADVSFEDLIEGVSADMPQVKIDPDSDFSILYTSGSTGVPKGVLLTHRGVINAVLSWSLLLNTINFLRPELKVKPDNPGMLLSLPLFHVTASHSAFLLSYLSGRKIVFMYQWNVQDALKLIKEENITNVAMVPTQSYELVEAAGPGDLDTLVDVTTGGAKRPAHHVTELKEKFPELNCSSGYGLTETNALACFNGMQDYFARPDSTGRVVPPVTELKIVADDGREVPAGTVGEVCIKSPANFRGYLAMPEETARVLTDDGWFHTGDLGKFDEEGFLYIVDRLKDLIIRGGENISCLEVENEIYKFDGVDEVAVFGIPDEKLGEIVGAVVYSSSGSVDLPALHKFLAGNIAAFKLPAKMWLSPQQLPRGGTDKIDKRTTKEFALQFPAHFSAS